MLPKNKKFLLPRRSLPAGDSDAQFAPEGDIGQCRLPWEETLAGVRKIDAILFDWGGVLVNKRKNYRPDPIIDELDRMNGSMADKKFIELAAKKYRLNKLEFNKLINKTITKYAPYKPLWLLLPALRKNYKLAIIRNGTSLTWPFFEKKHRVFCKNFDLLVMAGAEKFKKPDKKIYLLAAKRLGVQPKKCLFIDDLMENIKGAERAGLQTLWWQKPEESLKKLLAILK